MIEQTANLVFVVVAAALAAGFVGLVALIAAWEMWDWLGPLRSLVCIGMAAALFLCLGH